MLGFITNLFSNPDVVSKAADGVYNGIDKMFYTDEEKAEANKKVLDWQLDMMKATAPQNKSRRGIAWIVTGVWAFLIVSSVISKLIGWHEDAKFILELMAELVLNPFNIIIGFYFLTHVVKGFKKDS